MKAEGITRILLLSHVGYNRDREIAAAVDGISAIIGGHSHTRMSNTEEGAVEYATLIESPNGRAVPIVQAYAFSRYLGELQLEFAEDGAVASASGDTIALDASFAPAEDIAALIAPSPNPSKSWCAARWPSLPRRLMAAAKTAAPANVKWAIP